METFLIAPALVTLPKVGEFTLVSICEYWTMFMKLLDRMDAFIERPSPNRNVFWTDRLAETCLGPRIVFLPAFPNSQLGATNAAVLNHSDTPGLSMPTGRPVALARKV